MSTVVLQDTKVLLSSWEVAAFVTQGDQEAEDLRRAVVARALTLSSNGPTETFRAKKTRWHQL